jgi:Domain of Unknown Function (DUF748)
VTAVLAGLTLLAALLGTAGLGTLLVEQRLATLAPGGVTFSTLHYNPFTGRLVIEGVRAHDAAGRELLRADGVVARLGPVRLFLRPFSLGEARVIAPRLTLRASPGLDLAELAAGLGAAPAAATGLPVRIDDLIVSGGTLVVEGAGEHGAALSVRDLDVRLSRLTTATVDSHDVAFAVEMTVYGTVVHLTGQPRGAGYAIRVRARGLDVAALVRDFPVAMLQGLERGRGEVDADLFLSEGRLLASGSARASDVLLRLPVEGHPQLRAATLSAVLDAFDLTSGTGRVTRIDVGAPSLSLPAANAPAALAALAASLQNRASLTIRRVAVTDGTLNLADGAAGIRLEGLQLTAQAHERHGDGAWTLNARAGLGSGAEVVLDGVVARDLSGLEGAMRLQRVALAPWRILTGAPAEWDAHVSFDGRLAVAMREGKPAVTLAGRAVLADVGAAGAAGFHADRIVLGIRRLQWPDVDAIVDSVVMTRPAFALPAATPWPRLFVTGNVSVVDGKLREINDGRALHDLEVTLAPADATGTARVQLSASTEAGRLGVERLVPYDPSVEGAVPLPLLLAVIEDAARTERMGGPELAPHAAQTLVAPGPSPVAPR